MLLPLSTSALALDANREHRINANSFQQHAILSFNGWQYVAYYTNKDESSFGGPLLINIGRRRLSSPAPGSWEILTFGDYQQTVDDGHNTISFGICGGDGTIHMSFDHHCDQLHFRMSVPGVATDPEARSWTLSLFGPTLDSLPGDAFPRSIFSNVTYPRFISMGDDLLLGYRIGKAGAGSDFLFKYRSETRSYSYLGELLTGVRNNPYVNGIDYADGRLHVSGTYRGFVEYEGADDPESQQHKANAGPNGPENNYSLFYIYSDDNGDTFRNTKGEIVANVRDGASVLPDAPGLTVFDIPRYSGIMNQEGQAADSKGGFHVLNREKEVWYHYHRSPKGKWSKHKLPGLRPTNTGPRGSVVASLVGDTVYFAMPGNHDNRLMVVSADMASGEPEPAYRVCWESDGFSGEPQCDVFLSGGGQVLSIFTRTEDKERKLVVLDFAVDG